MKRSDLLPVCSHHDYEPLSKARFENKKTFVNYLIKRIEVSRGYKLNIEFNIDFEQFIVGIDKVA